MDNKHAIELEKWEIKDLTAEKAIDLLTSVSFISGPNIMFAIAYLIRNQDKSITDMQQRLSELDEKNQTQAHCLAARAEMIDKQEDQFRDATKMIERQERMIELAIEELCVLDCNKCIAESVCDKERPCGESWRLWLEQEAGK